MACPARPNLVPRLAFPPIFPVFSCIPNPFGTRGKTYDCKPNHNIPFAFGPLKKSKLIHNNFKNTFVNSSDILRSTNFFPKKFYGGALERPAILTYSFSHFRIGLPTLSINTYLAAGHCRPNGMSTYTWLPIFLASCLDHRAYPFGTRGKLRLPKTPWMHSINT